VQQNPVRKTPWVPIFIDAAFGFLSAVLLAKTLSRRISWSGMLGKATDTGVSEPEHELKSRAETPYSEGTYSPSQLSRASTPVPPSGMSSPTLVSGSCTPANGSSLPWYNMEQVNSRFPPAASNQDPIDAIIDSYGQNSVIPRSINASDTDNPFLSAQERGGAVDALADRNQQPPRNNTTQLTVPSGRVSGVPSGSTQHLTVSEKKKAGVDAPAIGTAAGGAKGTTNSVKIPTKRIDYLAGLIAISAVLVTMNHFGLTFWAAAM
jgi:hypothetical protein